MRIRSSFGRSALGLLVTLALCACGEDESSRVGAAAAGGHGAAGGAGAAGGSASTGGAGTGGEGTGGAGTGGSGAGGGGAVEPPIVCTDQCRYVRPGATGAATGTDWGDALPALPAELERGLVYLLADGSYGSYRFDDPPSGEELVTVRKATADDHGTSLGWQADFGDGVALFDEVAIATSYVLVEGTKGGGPGAWTSGHGIEIVATGTACGDNGSLLWLEPGASYVTVAHVHAHAESNDYPMNGVKGTGGNDHLTFRYDSVHTTFGPTFHIGDWSDVVIEKSFLADVRSTGSGDPICPDWHAEGIPSIGTNTNITIAHNLWDDIEGTAVIAGVNAGASVDWLIYGNVFARSVTTVRYYDEGGSSNQQTMDGLRFYNNSIVRMPGTSVATIAIDTGSDNEVFNNIWWDNIGNTFVMSGVTHDYNLFAENRRVEGCNPVCEKDDEGVADEAHGQVGAGSLFVDGESDPAHSDFHLLLGTDPGQLLPSPFDIDPNGVTRGADGVWDRGAYELAP